MAGGRGWGVTALDDVVEPGTSGAADYYRPGMGLDLTLSFGNREDLTFFALAGGGGVYNDVVPDSLDTLGRLVNAGGGVGTAPLFDSGLALPA